VVPFALATIAGMVMLWPSSQPHGRNQTGAHDQIVSGTVTGVSPTSCAGGSVPTTGTSTTGGATPTGTATTGGATPGGAAGCATVTVRLTKGPGAGASVQEVANQGPGTPHYQTGDKVVLSYTASAPDGLRYQIVDFDRNLPLAALGAAFALVVILVGRWRGLAALFALGLSFLALTLFTLPALLGGANPLALALVTASAIMLVALYLSHGVSVRTSIAVLGTLASLLLIGALSGGFMVLANLTGLGSEETQYVGSLYTQVHVRGLLLAGVIIGSLGVLFDVTVTQTSAVWELHAASPSLSGRALYRSGMRIGRDHIASTVNTLVLAYAGASLPLLLLFYVADRGLLNVLTSEVVAEEVARALIGGIGLVASVPLTTALAALVASRERAPGSTGRSRARGEPPVTVPFRPGAPAPAGMAGRYPRSGPPTGGGVRPGATPDGAPRTPAPDARGQPDRGRHRR
jgi:uncharacterized membrane protein